MTFMMLMMVRRRLILRLAACGIAMLTGSSLVGCKRRQDADRPGVFDEAPALARTESLAALAPPWTAPKRGLLDNGAWLVWLHEPNTPVVHVRVILPFPRGFGAPHAAAIASVGLLLHDDLERRMPWADVATEHRPNRLELVVHAPAERDDLVLRTLATSLGSRPQATMLDRARTRAARGTQLDVEGRALAQLVATLEGRDSQHVAFGTTDVTALTRADASAAWTELTDAKRAVVIVHAGRAQTPAVAREFARQWPGRGLKRPIDGALARIRAPTDAVSTEGLGRLGAAPTAALQRIDGARQGHPVLWLGRRIPLATVEDRALARLCQRVLQEALDVRLVLAGDFALFAMRVNVVRSDAAASTVRDALAELTQQVRTRQPSQRLFQAAQLWLGARVVQASISGEDWTALWSESLDLATDEGSVAVALARDAGAMLSAQPEALLEWQKRWLDPAAGDPSWTWVIGGASASAHEQLQRELTVSRRR